MQVKRTVVATMVSTGLLAVLALGGTVHAQTDHAHDAPAGQARGGPVPSPPGSLDRFLVERYALFSALAGRLLRVRVRHAPWELRAARVDALEQTLARAAGLWVEDRPALARFSDG